MKKIYLLSLLVCASVAAFGQSTRYVYATGASGSYATGASSNTTRSDDNISAIPFMQRAYAVFNLAAGLPSGALITSVNLGWDIANVTSTGGAGSTIRGYNGNLALMTVPATLYATMGSATTYYSTTWPTSAGNTVSASTPPAATFVQNCFSGGAATGYASIIWAAGGGMPPGLNYNITGETGTTATSGAHAPYLAITYNCAGLVLTANVTPASVCPNTAFTLHSGGTTAVSYSWSGPGGFSSTLANPTVSGGLSVSGTYTITALNATGCDAQKTVFVNVLPAPSAVITALTSTAFCVGDNAVLEGPTVAGDQYQWFDGGTAIPGATDLTYTSLGNGNFTLQVTDAAGCVGTSLASVPVVLFDAPPAISPASPFLLCLGDNGTMNVNTNGVTGGIDFQWSDNGTDIAGATDNNYTASTSGAYSCFISVVINGCTVTSVIDTVIVNAYPTPLISVIGTNLKTVTTYASYQWFLNTVAIPGATNSTVHPASNGSYRVRVTDGNGCTAFSSSFPYYTVGVGQLNKQGVSIYPNPASTVLHIESPEMVNAVISGLEGRILLRRNDAKDIDISMLSNGLYIISLYNEAGERIAVQQIVKE
jgi:hypothetical protein